MLGLRVGTCFARARDLGYDLIAAKRWVHHSKRTGPFSILTRVALDSIMTLVIADEADKQRHDAATDGKSRTLWRIYTHEADCLDSARFASRLDGRQSRKSL